MAPFRAAWLAVPISIALAGCSPDFSPNTYSATAVQQANKVEQGIVVGVRAVDVKVAGTTGAVAGAAAGGIAGSQLPGSNTSAALGAVGGSLIGGLLGSGVEQATGDTKAYEYIVRKPNGELVSVTQVDKVAMALGQRVLVIAGNQARIVPDYTTALPETPKEAVAKAVRPAAPGADAPVKDSGTGAVPAADAPKKESLVPTSLAPTSLAPTLPPPPPGPSNPGAPVAP